MAKRPRHVSSTSLRKPTGELSYVGAERGASLERGNLIVRLDKRDRAARLAQAQATLKQREVEYDARLRLKSESYVSEAQLQEAVALLETARAEVTRANSISATCPSARLSRAHCRRAVSRLATFVSRGDPIATYVDNRKIIVSANLSEFDARFVNVDDTAEAALATGETVRGRIRYVAPVADEATRTFEVELEVDNADGHSGPVELPNFVFRPKQYSRIACLRRSLRSTTRAMSA